MSSNPDQTQHRAREDSSDNVVAAATAAATDEFRSEALAAVGRAFLAAPSDPSILERLERAAEAAEDWAGLAHVFRTVASRPLGLEQQVDLRCRLGRLYTHNLGELDRAIATYRRVLDLSPTRTDIASALEGLYVRTERWTDLADYLAERDAQDQLIDVLARNLPDGSDEQVSGYLQVARLFEERLHDPDKAIEAASRAVSLDPTSVDALHAAFRLYRQAGWHERCLDTLELELDAVQTGDERVDVLTRMTRLCDSELDDLERAAECLENVLLIDDQRVERYEELEGYYRRLDSPERLADCYERHGEAESAPLARADLLEQAATLYRDELDDHDRATWVLRQLGELAEHELDDHDRAAAAQRAILDMAPQDSEAADALDRLYTRRGRWSELADLLVDRVSALQEIGDPADDPAGESDHVTTILRATILRLAELREHRLDDVAMALAGYQELLVLEPGFQPALKAIERLLDHPDHGRSAALALEPFYRDDEQWAGLVRVYEVMHQHAQDAWERSELLVRVARLEESRGRPDAAFLAYERALGEDASDEPILEHMEELARAGRRWPELATILVRLTSAPLSPEIHAELHVRLGRVYWRELGRVEDAITTYRAVLEMPAGAAEAAEALEALYVASRAWVALAEHLQHRGDWDGLVDVLARHLPEDPDEQLRCYLDVVRICQEQLDDDDQAIEAAERALALDPGALEVLRILFRLYHRTEKYERCLDMLELELGTVTSNQERVTVLIAMARLSDEGLNDLDKAAECIENVLLIDEQHRDGYRQLRGYYDRMNAWPALAECYRREIAVESDLAARVVLQRALLTLYREQLHDDDSADALEAELAAEGPGAGPGADPRHE